MWGAVTMKDLLKRIARSRSSTLALVVSLLFLPLAPLATQVTGASLYVALAGSGALTALVLLARWMDNALSDYIHATSLLGQAMLLTALFTGHPWQMDMHMLFFAMLAIISINGRIGVLVYGCGITAVHHLGLTVVLPALVFPSSDLLVNVLRTALHGGIVVMEGLVLALAMHSRNENNAMLAENTRKLETGTRMAEDAQAEVQEAHQRASAVIDEMRVALSRLAARDLASGIQKAFPAQYEVLRNEFNTTLDTLREAFAAATETANGFSSDSNNLAHSLRDLAQLTDLQARALEEMTAATELLVDTLGQTAEQAKEAARSSGEARDSADKGSEVTEQAIAAMRQIEESSRQISSIVDLIDDVSFQTNLLALNAGVEAARAGEAGKGFAVVAMEVQQLSLRTAEAASGIKTLIQASSDQVNAGAELVDAAGRRLNDIRAQISRASELANAISARNIEQTGSLTELHGMVRSANDQTRRAAEMGDTLAELSRHMTQASERLSDDMASFTLDETEDRRAAS